MATMSEEIQTTKLEMRSGAAVLPISGVETEQAGARIAEEQLAYARLLDAGMKVGFVALLVTFGLYVSGVLTPHVPVEELPKYWAMPVKTYLAATGIHPGWGWILMLGKGDFINFVGIAFLASVAIVCYIAIIPILFRKKDYIYAWLCVAEVLVLTLAASGLLKGGGH